MNSSELQSFSNMQSVNVFTAKYIILKRTNIVYIIDLWDRYYHYSMEITIHFTHQSQTYETDERIGKKVVRDRKLPTILGLSHYHGFLLF